MNHPAQNTANSVLDTLASKKRARLATTTNPTDMASWACSGRTYWATPPGRASLPVGIYALEATDQGPAFTQQRNDTDQILALPDSASEEVVAEIAKFKTLRPAFQKHGFLYKRGIFLWGPPGSGKTCTIQLIIKMLLEEHDSIACLIRHPHIAAQCLQKLRQIEPDRQVVAIMEDLDALVEEFDEPSFLSLLDGEAQIDNIVYVATSNYPEKLDKRFLDRPSRFDTVRYVGMPSDEARRVYLSHKLPDASLEELERHVQYSKGYSIAHLREMIVLTQCFGNSVEQAKQKLDYQRLNRPNSEHAPDKQKIGFFGN